MAETPTGTSRGGGGRGRLRARFEAVLQQMPAGVVIAEAPSGKVVLGNQHIDAIWRRSLATAESVADYAQWQGFHADGRPYAAEEWPLARSLATGEVVEGEEIEIQRGDDTRGVVRVSSTPLRDGRGRITAAVLTAFDITEQRREEVARQFMSEATSQLASSLDYEDTLRNVARLAVPALADWCNIDIVREGGAIQRLAVEHVDPAQAEVAREMAHRYPPDPQAQAGAARVLRTGEAELLEVVDEEVLRGVARDEEHLGLLRRLGMRSAMVLPLVARGRTLGAMAFILTGSGRRYSEREFQLALELANRAALAIDNSRLYRESQAANRAKSDFLAVISHELRTPLTAVIGYSELLRMGVPDPITERQAEQVERIEVSARHLLQLIEEILTLVSVESGQARLRPEPVPLGELLHRAEVITLPMATAKGLSLRVESPATEVLLHTDADRVVQVLLNLVGNAIKFTDQGEIRLVARAGADGVSVEVRDSGIGLMPEHRERIFDAFWQAEQPITRKAGGTGLGLTITRRLLELLGGRIEVESEPGEGSTFRVWLPLVAPSSAGAADGG